MGAYSVEVWGEFAGAQIAASAALLGLVFVGVSINLSNIVASRALVNRAAGALVALSLVLVTSTALLVPGQSSAVVAGELVVVGALALALTVQFERGSRTETRSHVGPAALALRLTVGLGAPTLVLVAGLGLAAETGGGLYWWAGSIVFAYLAATTSAWVLLVEILR